MRISELSSDVCSSDLELPYINDISIQHENFRSNTPEIIQKLTGMTAIGSQMHIRYNNYVNVAFSHLPDKDRLDLLTKFLEIIKILLSSRRPAGGAACGINCRTTKKIIKTKYRKSVV